MPTFRTGEMFRASGFIIVTANSFLTSEVKLVMGRGAALQLKRKEPGIDLEFGKKIHERCGHLGFYGLIFHRRYGLAQVKCRFNERARVGLIRISMSMLGNVARRDRGRIFNVNFPGIGNGGLKRHQVESLLRDLPENVHVWEKEGGLVYGLHPGVESKSILHPPENSLGLGGSHDRSDGDGLRACSANRG